MIVDKKSILLCLFKLYIRFMTSWHKQLKLHIFQAPSDSIYKLCNTFNAKFRPGIAFTICTNQFHLPKNNRENLKLISNVHGFWRNGTRFQFPLEHFVWKNRTSFSEDPLPRKFSDETIQKVQSRVPFTCRPVFLESFCKW